FAPLHSGNVGTHSGDAIDHGTCSVRGAKRPTGEASDARSATVTVLNNREGIQTAIAHLQAVYSAGSSGPKVFSPRNGVLTGALATTQAGRLPNMLRQLNNFLTRHDAFDSAGQFPSADAATLREFVPPIVASIEASERRPRSGSYDTGESLCAPSSAGGDAILASPQSRIASLGERARLVGAMT
ncbi:MAG: hypothetical protein ABI910_15035, partial [Gemmatimonadota bacterium]